MVRRHPRSPRTAPLFPYTTRFRSARSLAVRARLPVAGDADHDKLRIEGRQLLPAQPPLLQRPGTEILDHDVDFAGQATYDLARLVALEVERDRLLVATLRVPPQRGTLVEVAPFAQRIPVLRRPIGRAHV